jgi:hypothetical protein
MSDPLTTLFDDEPIEDEATEAQVEDVTETEQEPGTGEDAAEAAPESPEPPAVGKGEKKAAPPAEVDAKGQTIPITALLDEREKRQKAEREAEELRRWRADMESRQSKEKPDFFDNPEAALQQQEQRFQQMLVQDRVQRSVAMAEQEHGKEFVAEVVEFFNDPKHMPKSHEFLRHPFPMMEAIRYYRQQQALAEIGDDPASYRERVKAEILAEMQAQPAAVQPQRPATPPRSLASAPSVGDANKAAPSGFDALFPE